MKTRLDYVSNSSSSSFMLVGDAFDDDTIAKAWHKLHPEDNGQKDSYELADAIADELGLDCRRGLDNYYELWVIGLSFDSMEDDETKRQFKDRIEAALGKAFDDPHANACLDGGYDG